jgi:two-component system, chemotaxis family, response regulator Rcp1
VKKVSSFVPEHQNIPMPLLNILLVEDNPADSYLTTLALRDEGLCQNLQVVEYGEQALAFLRQEGPYKDAFHPDLVILDVNLPRMNGLAVLAAMKADPILRRIPVIVFSTSSAEQDVSQAYRLGAAHYFVKPNTIHECLTFGHKLARAWQQLVPTST